MTSRLTRPRNIARTRQPTAEGSSLQDEVDGLARELPRFWWKQGSLLDVTFAAGVAQDIAHKLSGAHQGFVVVGKKAVVAADIFEQTTGGTTAPIGATHIRLQASAACVAKLWVWR